MTKFDAEKVEINGTQHALVITDKETGVQYLLATSLNTIGIGAGMTVLVDENGKPKLRK